MISLIISTYRQNLLKELKENIERTIGDIEYELLVTYNPNSYSLTTVYNKLAKTSEYDILIFLHEDVKFISNNWGKHLVNALSQYQIGIIGVAGCSKRFKIPSGIDLGIHKYRSINVVHDEDELLKSTRESFQVRTIDGVFMAMNKEVWESHKFNENIRGFHGYDLDLSMRVSEKYQNVVLPNITIQHFSMGNFGNAWIKAILNLYKNPEYIFDKPTKKELNQVRKYWYLRLKNEDISFINRVKYILAMGLSLMTYKETFKFLLATRRP